MPSALLLSIVNAVTVGVPAAGSGEQASVSDDVHCPSLMPAESRSQLGNAAAAATAVAAVASFRRGADGGPRGVVRCDAGPGTGGGSGVASDGDRDGDGSSDGTCD